jgi:hypothetical protein
MVDLGCGPELGDIEHERSFRTGDRDRDGIAVLAIEA